MVGGGGGGGGVVGGGVVGGGGGCGGEGNGGDGEDNGVRIFRGRVTKVAAGVQAMTTPGNYKMSKCRNMRTFVELGRGLTMILCK